MMPLVEIGIMVRNGVPMMRVMLGVHFIDRKPGIEEENGSSNRPVRRGPERHQGAVHAVVRDYEKPDVKPALTSDYKQRHGPRRFHRKKENCGDVEESPRYDNRSCKADADCGLTAGHTEAPFPAVTPYTAFCILFFAG